MTATNNQRRFVDEEPPLPASTYWTEIFYQRESEWEGVYRPYDSEPIRLVASPDWAYMTRYTTRTD